jgi:hypothetical protein
VRLDLSFLEGPLDGLEDHRLAIEVGDDQDRVTGLQDAEPIALKAGSIADEGPRRWPAGDALAVPAASGFGSSDRLHPAITMPVAQTATNRTIVEALVIRCPSLDDGLPIRPDAKTAAPRPSFSTPTDLQSQAHSDGRFCRAAGV